MTGRTRHDVRRQLFRGITTRMSSHNSSTIGHHGESVKDDIKTDMSTPSSSSSSISHHNQQSQIQLQQQQVQQQQQQQQQQPQYSQQGLSNNTEITSNGSRVPSRSKRSLLRRSQVITPIPSESIDPNFTPNSTISTATDASDLKSSRTDQVIIKKTEDLNNLGYDYDYKTFSTNRPLRISKIKAFEQAETVTNLHFAKDDEDIYDNDPIVILRDSNDNTNNTNHSRSIRNHISNYKNKKGIKKDLGIIMGNNGNKDKGNGKGNNGNNNNDNNILIQIPDFTAEETSKLIAHEESKRRLRTAELDNDDDINDEVDDEDEELNMYMRGGLSDSIFNTNSNNNGFDFNKNYSAFKVNGRNVLRSTSVSSFKRESATSRKIMETRIDRKFVNTASFLNDLTMEEIDSFVELNEEYENEMQMMKRRLQDAENEQIDISSTPIDTLESQKTLASANVLSEDLRRKVKSIME